MNPVAETIWPTVAELLTMSRADRNWWRGVIVEVQLDLMESQSDPLLFDHLMSLYDTILMIEYVPLAVA